jgi:hypothetical protein
MPVMQDARAHRCNRFTSRAHWIQYETDARNRQHILPRLRSVGPLLHCKAVDPPKNFEKKFKSNLDKMIRSGSTLETA